MKNKLFKILICVIILFELTGCKKKYNDDKISLSIKEGTLTNGGAILILKNDSKADYSYVEAYYIEQEVDGKWKEVKEIHDVTFNLPSLDLKSKKSVEINIDWRYGYGQLEKGKYRIVKEIFRVPTTYMDNSESFNVYTEFELK